MRVVHRTLLFIGTIEREHMDSAYSYRHRCDTRELISNRTPEKLEIASQAGTAIDRSTGISQRGRLVAQVPGETWVPTVSWVVREGFKGCVFSSPFGNIRFSLSEVTTPTLIALRGEQLRYTTAEKLVPFLRRTRRRRDYNKRQRRVIAVTI